MIQQVLKVIKVTFDHVTKQINMQSQVKHFLSKSQVSEI